MARLKPIILKRCPDHEASEFIGSCGLCAAGVWPDRDLRALDDFHGVPLYDIRLATPGQLVRSLTASLVEAERRIAEASKAAVEPRNEMRRDARLLGFPYLTLLRAVRAHVGLPGASTFENDPDVSVILYYLRGEDLK